jgi:thioredoxin reductase
MFDVVIVGGAVAGLSAGLLLGRCRRDVVICDAGRPRNRFSHAMHGFLSREGISPKEFLEISRNQIARFPNVQFREGTVTRIEREGDGFAVETGDGVRLKCRFVLLATGITDELPDLRGAEELYGRSLHHCPYCDGWEHRDEPLAVYGKGEAGIELASEMLVWSRDLIYFSDGVALAAPARDRLRGLGVEIIETKIDALVGNNGSLEAIVLSDGKRVERKAMFFIGPQHQNSELARKLGCDLEEGFVTCGEESETCVPGLYVAGNTSTGLQLAIVAAAEGARAAHAINTKLTEQTGPWP